MNKKEKHTFKFVSINLQLIVKFALFKWFGRVEWPAGADCCRQRASRPRRLRDSWIYDQTSGRRVKTLGGVQRPAADCRGPDEGCSWAAVGCRRLQWSCSRLQRHLSLSTRDCKQTAVSYSWGTLNLVSRVRRDHRLNCRMWC